MDSAAIIRSGYADTAFANSDGVTPRNMHAIPRAIPARYSMNKTRHMARPGNFRPTTHPPDAIGRGA